ncbi:MAG TPA: LysR family transcriptional regulator [Candidatus Nitrosotalea sp.]|nr:LysR family transcriptional regulator [Candidatus Nitrosotalea sp.]
MPPKLDLAHLRLLCALHDQQTLTAAAQLLCVTPSAASHRLREAESRLGLDLVTRVAGNLRLAPAGMRLERRAREILKLVEAAEAEAVEIAHGKKGAVIFGIAAHGPFRRLSSFMAEIKAQRPDIEFAVATLREDEMYTALYQGRIDIGIVHDAVSTRSAKTVPLFADDLIAVMAKDHPLAGRERLMPQDFVPYEFFTYTLEHITGWEHDRFFTPFGLVPVRRTEIAIIEAVIELVRAGLGLTILGRDVVAPHLANGDLTWAHLGTGLSLGWSAMMRSDEPASGLVAQMVKLLARWTKTMDKPAAKRTAATIAGKVSTPAAQKPRITAVKSPSQSRKAAAGKKTSRRKAATPPAA